MKWFEYFRLPFLAVLKAGNMQQNYLVFIQNNYKLLLFGFVLALFSSFGQTFLISLYVPEIANTFTLSNTQISSMYASATLASAFTLPWVGRYIDFWPLIRFTFAVILGLLLALLALSFAVNPIMVLIGFWGLRLTGQGLMGHTAVSTMARAYDLDRGKAISLAGIGHPMGEAIFPLIVALSISQLGWRIPLRLSAASLILLVVPLIFILLQGASNDILRPNKGEVSRGALKKSSNPIRLFRSRHFWYILPGVLYLGAINTAIFFFQIQFGESRGWSIEWVAGSIAAFASASACGMLLAGPMVDRFTAKKLFPFFILPYLLGLLLLAFFQFSLVYPISLAFMGFSNGFGATVKNAIYAEIFGTEAIGSIRSIFATVVVFATAIGPIAFGFFLDRDVTFSWLLIWAAGIAFLVTVWSLQVLKIK